jgi:Flp pilus assembly protein TadG
VRTLLRRLGRDRRGASAVEFALIGPVFCLVFAGAVDIGGALFTKMKLDAAVAAGVNYAQVNAASVGAANGATLASNIATVVATSQGAGWADDTVVVNHGPQTSVSGGAASSSGAASDADQCYCPTGTTSSLDWGAAQTCGAACPSGGYAGKFVTIAASRSYTPIFSTYGLVQNPMSVSAAVQVQ